MKTGRIIFSTLFSDLIFPFKTRTDMYILAVDPATNTIVSVPEVLKIIDSEYDFLKDYYAGFAIENVVPAFAQVSNHYNYYYITFVRVFLGTRRIF